MCVTRAGTAVLVVTKMRNVDGLDGISAKANCTAKCPLMTQSGHSAERTCRRGASMSALGRAFVMLHLALHLAYLILQLPARALEGIVERVVDVRITLVVLRRAADIDLAAFR